jgi:uncharacterized membrane protein
VLLDDHNLLALYSMSMKARVRAFLIHLIGSMVLAGIAVALVFGVWYPAPLHHAVGVTTIFLILLGVDVVLGPLLTFIVFDPKKNHLALDLGIIIFIQLAAFSYGIGIVAQGRPVWLVFSADRADLVRAHEVDGRRLDEAEPQFREVPLLGPEWVAANLPEDREARTTLLFESLFAGVDLPQRPDLYVPLSEASDAIKEKLRPLDELNDYNSRAAVSAVLEKWPEADAWLPMMAPQKPVTVLLKRDTAEVIAVVDLAPWKD